jgi:hypothetical protein
MMVFMPLSYLQKKPGFIRETTAIKLVASNGCFALRGSAVNCALALASSAATSGDYFSRLANNAASCAHQAVAYRQNPVRLAMAEKMAINRYNWYSIYQ